MKNITKSILSELVDKNENEERRFNIEAGRKNLRTYCNLINPDFFKPEREYQDRLLNTLQAAYEKKLINPKTGKPYRIIIINMPPGYGKSYSVANFITWAYGQNIKHKVITVSYNGIIAPEFSKTVRNMVQEEKFERDDNSYVCTSFFPRVKIKYGDAAVMKWSLEGSYSSYLATSFDGTVTGMRGDIIIIDDPIKNDKEAVNEDIKNGHYNYYKNTLKSRMLPDALQIIVQTRWATDDLAGRLLAEYPDKCYELKLTALDENDKSTCEDLYPTEDLLDKRETLDDHIWLANYQQTPIDKKGALYGEFKTYDVIDTDKFERTINYTDTADEGADYLCSISGGVIGRYGYITDIYYTDEGMEVTEGETARKLHENNVRECLIESNNGGRGFARNVIAKLKALKNRKCNVTWFFNSKKKKTRILVNASNVMEQVIMPEDWKKRFPEFAKTIKKYQRKGKNEHDDAPDALTGFVEFINGDVKGRKKVRIGNKRKLGL